MRTDTHHTVQLGALVVAAFDSAAQHSTDPREVSRLATEAVIHLLRRARESHIHRDDCRLSKRATHEYPSAP
jgi:hypothetical protein